jgi:hypothetical protein
MLRRARRDLGDEEAGRRLLVSCRKPSNDSFGKISANQKSPAVKDTICSERIVVGSCAS